MNDPVYEMSTTPVGGEPAAAETNEPMYEPPGYLPSSYQPITGPVNLVPKFDAPAPAPAPAAPAASARASASAESPATLPSAPPVGSVLGTSATASPTAATPKPESMAELLQTLPAPTQAPQAASVREPVMAAAPAKSAPAPDAPASTAPPVASAASLANLPAPAAGTSSQPGAASVPGSTATAPPAAVPAVPAANPVAAPTSVAPTSAPAVAQAAASAMPASEVPPAPKPATVAAAAPAATPSAPVGPPTAPAAAPSATAPAQPAAPAAPEPTQPVAPPRAEPSRAEAPSTPSVADAPASAEEAVHRLPGPVPVTGPAQSLRSRLMPSPSASMPMPKQAPAQTPAGFASRRNPELNADPDLDNALQQVLLTSGSDLHISAGAPPMIRIDGALRPIKDVEPWSQDKVSAALHSILMPKQREIFEEQLEFDFAYTLSENARFRVNLYQQRNNMGAAFRLIPTEIKPLSALGVPESIASFAKLPRGLVLVTGPTGSGKSTTLAALIDLVNKTRTDHIMTVEDPIEFLHQNQKSLINQREVGHDTHSFAAALKHVLRQDPDVILVGELRDLETISVALTAAETGHLVFATLHTQDAPQTIDRIIDVYPPHQQNQVRAQLAATLQGVVCQTLLKRANGKGRVVATEVLMATHGVANLIREGKTYQVHSAMQAGRELGMHTLDQHLADLVNSGQVSFSAAAEKAQDYEVLKRLVTRVDTSGAVGATMSGGVDFSDAYSVQS